MAFGAASITRAPQNGGCVARTAAGGGGGGGAARGSRAPERWLRDRNVGGEATAALAHRVDVDRLERARIGLTQGARGVSGLADAPRLHRRKIIVERVAGDAVHHMQPVERVAAIGDAAAGISADA